MPIYDIVKGQPIGWIGRDRQMHLADELLIRFGIPTDVSKSVLDLYPTRDQQASNIEQCFNKWLQSASDRDRVETIIHAIICDSEHVSDDDKWTSRVAQLVHTTFGINENKISLTMSESGNSPDSRPWTMYVAGLLADQVMNGAEAERHDFRAALEEIAHSGVCHKHNHNRNDLAAVSAWTIARRALGLSLEVPDDE